MAIIHNDNNKPSIWAIAWVGFFWSLASLMVFSVLPIFLKEELGISYRGIGILEGMAIATAYLAKIISGVSSDYFRCRKPLLIIGSIITIITKFMFAAASSINIIFISRFFDRLGKGIRSAPTDAIVADLSGKDTATRSYSIRQAMYALGTVSGAAISMLLLNHYVIKFRLIFTLASIPALLALCILYFYVVEPKNLQSKSFKKWQISDVYHLPIMYWFLLLITGILMLARFSEMFMTLWANDIGWPTKYLPLIIIIVNLCYAIAAFVNKNLANKISDRNLLLVGLCFLLFAHTAFAFGKSRQAILLGIIFDGLHLGMTQGILRSMIAKICPQHLTGTAFALFYLVSGIGVSCGNLIAGSLAEAYGGLHASFIGGITATSTAMLIFYISSAFYSKS